MEPTSPSVTRNSSVEPTPEEIEAGASLPRDVEPERLESRAADPPPAPPPAVQTLIEKHDKAPHGGVALSVGVNAAVGLGVAVGGEISVGIVVDMVDPQVSVFMSSASGIAAAPGLSVGASTQVAAVKDLEKFWGSGAEDGLNLAGGGLARNYSTPGPGGELEPNGYTESLGPSFGFDAHRYEGTTERLSLSWEDIKSALERAVDLPGPRRFGP